MHPRVEGNCSSVYAWGDSIREYFSHVWFMQSQRIAAEICPILDILMRIQVDYAHICFGICTGRQLI